MTAVVQNTVDDITPRQGEVLDAALQLLISGGDKLTMIAVAQQASCSKETLYKWFGDRDGLLTATVQWQASKVRMPQFSEGQLNAGSLRDGIEQFGLGLLTVLASDISVALNRVAVSHAASTSSSLGTIVLDNGRRTIGRRLKPILEAGRGAGFLSLDDAEEAFRTFFGLLVRDMQIRLLLGDALRPSEDEIKTDAHRATEQFFALYGA